MLYWYQEENIFLITYASSCLWILEAPTAVEADASLP